MVSFHCLAGRVGIDHPFSRDNRTVKINMLLGVGAGVMLRGFVRDISAHADTKLGPFGIL